MGNGAGLKALQVLANAERVLAIELLASAQGLDLRGDSAESPEVRRGLAAVRAVASRVTADRALGGDIERLAAALGTERFDRWSAGAPLDGEWA
jgi:histidine ammonia-lyase